MERRDFLRKMGATAATVAVSSTGVEPILSKALNILTPATPAESIVRLATGLLIPAQIVKAQARIPENPDQRRLESEFRLTVLDSFDHNGNTFRFTAEQVNWILEVLEYSQAQILRDAVRNKTVAASHNAYNRPSSCGATPNRLADFFIGVHPEPRVFKFKTRHEFMHDGIDCLPRFAPYKASLQAAFRRRRGLTNYARSRTSEVDQFSESCAELPAAWFDTDEDNLRDTENLSGGLNPFCPQLINQYREYAEVAQDLFGPRPIRAA